MIKQLSAIFVILISMINTSLFSQSFENNDYINREFFNLPTKQLLIQEKSSATFSIGAGYAVNMRKSEIPDGSDVQLDLIFPVTSYLAINGSFNYAGFPKYQTTKFYGYPGGDLLFDHGTQTNITLSPGISFGNFRKDNKFNYFITAGFAVGFGTSGSSSVTQINNGQILNHESGGLLEIVGILTSGRVSYKLSQQYNVYIEPLIYALLGSDSAGSNYHINAGVSISL
jgi:hypothetical protein